MGLEYVSAIRRQSKKSESQHKVQTGDTDRRRRLFYREKGVVTEDLITSLFKQGIMPKQTELCCPERENVTKY